MPHDLRYAFRLLRNSPGFSTVAILTLALGIGANAVIFLLVNAVLLRPLPFKDQDRLVVVDTVQHGDRVMEAVSYPDFLDWKARSRGFESMEAYGSTSGFLTGVKEPEQVHGLQISTTFLRALGLKPVLGRNFLPAEAVTGAPHVVLLSHGLWQRAFGSDPSIVGKSLALDVMREQRSYIILGVMPARAALPLWMSEFDFLVPVGEAEPSWVADRQDRSFGLLAWLRLGTSADQAGEEMRAIAASLEREYPITNRDISAQVVPLREAMIGKERASLFVLVGAVAFVLLIACANLANLLLARATAREREFAVRLAIGSSRWRLVRQLLVESAVLSTAGAVGGLLLVFWLRDAVVTRMPFTLAQMGPFGLDWRVFMFTAAAMVLTTMAFGLAPAVQVSGLNPHDWLRTCGAPVVTPEHRHLRSSLVVGEIALALVLVVGASLMAHTLMKLQRVDLGLAVEHISTARIALPSTRYRERPRVEAFYLALLERIRGLEDVEGASLASHPPLWNVRSAMASTQGGLENLNVDRESITPDYFRTVGIPVVLGRPFDDRDSPEGPGAVAIVNRVLATQLFRGENPIGRKIVVQYDKGSAFEVVGVVGDTRRGGPAHDPVPEVYVPAKGQWVSNYTTLIVRSHRDAAVLAPQVREQLRALDPDVPMPPLEPLTKYLDYVQKPRRFAALLIISFAALALGLAILGLYGVMSYLVGRRVHEIGVRMALGAAPRQIVGMILKSSTTMVGAGLVLGVLGALALTRTLQTWLFEVSPTDPLTFALGVTLLGAVATSAAYLPARRASRLNPVVALREE